MSTTNVIQATTPSGACPFAELPHELMAQVFLHTDPHTLYTAIRQLNRNWRETVESHLIPMLFRTRQWRVALRIHKRPRRVHPNSIAGGAAAHQADGHPGEGHEARVARILATVDAHEDELLPPEANPLKPEPVTEYIPLELERVNAAKNQFEFSTADNWYALYELDERARAGDTNFRLDLDFGVAWRFEGDGKENEEQRPGGWTTLDQENGWLSKFYCSTFDLNTTNSTRRGGLPSLEEVQRAKGRSTDSLKLNCTSLARRRRRRVPPKLSSSLKQGQARPLYWDDSHIEYLHLELALGTEFFVRRSARANLLMRALEAEAARREEVADDAASDETSALRQRPSSQPYLHRPKPSSPAAKHAVLSGNMTPPPSRNSPGNLRPDMSPAEQLQMMAKSKAAAKAAGSHNARSAHGGNGSDGTGSFLKSGRRSDGLPGWARGIGTAGSSRNTSRATSRAPSRAVSAAPSRAPSRPPSRPGTPTQSLGDQLGPSGSETPSIMLTTPAIPGTPVASPRDMPFFRAAALSLSTASPFTHRALSGYTTPNAGALGANSFALRGGGGAEPGGTPFAEFKARLRRAKGFQPPPAQQKRAISPSGISGGVSVLDSDTENMTRGFSHMDVVSDHVAGSSRDAEYQAPSYQSRKPLLQANVKTSPSQASPTYWVRTAGAPHLEADGVEREWRHAQERQCVAGDQDSDDGEPEDDDAADVTLASLRRSAAQAQARGAMPTGQPGVAGRSATSDSTTALPIETEWVWSR